MSTILHMNYFLPGSIATGGAGFEFNELTVDTNGQTAFQLVTGITLPLTSIDKPLVSFRGITLQRGVDYNLNLSGALTYLGTLGDTVAGEKIIIRV